jgi:hypothetical protein
VPGIHIGQPDVRNDQRKGTLIEADNSLETKASFHDLMTLEHET